MELVDIIILSLVQGLTEFLPVSSSGHLLIVRHWWGIGDTAGNAFDAWLHLGTLLAVFVYFRSTWWEMLRGVLGSGQDKAGRELAGKLAVATVPAAVAGYIWQGQFAAELRSINTVIIGLLVTAVALALVEAWPKKPMEKKQVSYRDSLLIGLAQIIALVPGVSRSGVTMAAGRGRGLSRSGAAKFSFLMSAPIIAGAGLSSIGALATGGFTGLELGLGFLTAFGAGILAIGGLLKLIEKYSYWPYVIYLVALAMTVWFIG